MQKIIEMKNITVFRGETQVFNGLTLEITRGCNTAILGPNGAGKSTLLKLLTREIYPSASNGGTIRVLGRELWNVWELRTHFGIISSDLQQEYAGDARGIEVILSGYYSSIDTYAHQRFTAKERKRAARVMDILGVSELADREFAAMSTGEQRRFLLGRALINDPDSLILDEPTSGLDLKSCFQYLNIVRRLMRAGKTVILVTHHIHEIPPEVSRVVFLQSGRVVAEGKKREILTSESLTSLFDTPIRLVEANGFFQAMPGRV
jgi:iron complex transport system ATP-binding protein